MVEPAVTCPASLPFAAIRCAGFFAPAPSSPSTSSFKFPVAAPSAIVAKIEKAASKAVAENSRIGLIDGSVSYLGQCGARYICDISQHWFSLRAKPILHEIVACFCNCLLVRGRQYRDDDLHGCGHLVWTWWASSTSGRRRLDLLRRLADGL